MIITSRSYKTEALAPSCKIWGEILQTKWVNWTFMPADGEAYCAGRYPVFIEVKPACNSVVALFDDDVL